MLPVSADRPNNKVIRYHFYELYNISFNTSETCGNFLIDDVRVVKPFFLYSTGVYRHVPDVCTLLSVDGQESDSQHKS